MSSSRLTSSSPSGIFDVAMAVQNVIKVFGAKLQIHIPVVVTEDYDPETDLVEVQPIMTKAFDEESETVYEEWSKFNVHVAHFGIEGLLFVFPVKKGMTGWVMSSDRDVFKSREENSNVNYEDNQGPSDPSSFDMGRYTQGIFVPDRWFPEKSKYGIGYGADEGTEEDGHEDDIGVRMINTDDDKGGIFLNKTGVLFIEKNEKKIRIDLSGEEKISVKTKIGESEINVDIDASANVDIKNDGDLNLTCMAQDENPLNVRVSKADNIVRMETEERVVEIDFNLIPSGEKIGIQETWLPTSIDENAISFGRYRVMRGEQEMGSKTVIDDIGEK